jgi:hypothetical protein
VSTHLRNRVNLLLAKLRTLLEPEAPSREADLSCSCLTKILMGLILLLRQQSRLLLKFWRQIYFPRNGQPT